MIDLVFSLSGGSRALFVLRQLLPLADEFGFSNRFAGALEEEIEFIESSLSDMEKQAAKKALDEYKNRRLGHGGY